MTGIVDEKPTGWIEIDKLANMEASILGGEESKMATRTVSATEAKNRFGAIVKSAREDVDVVFVENHGEPYAIILSPSEFQRLQDADKELRKRMRLERLEEIMRAQAERNKDLTPEEADELAIRAVREYRASRRLDRERN